nr:ATP synthase F0 subunit 8 [Eucinostomus jonesii]
MPQLELSNWFSSSLWAWGAFIVLPLKLMASNLVTDPRHTRSGVWQLDWSWTW